MALDFSYQSQERQPQVEEQQQVTEEQTTPIEEVPQRSGYFSPKRSDKLQSFISMQRTVNAALQKDIDTQRQQQPTMQPVAAVGGAWEKDSK